MSRKSNIGWARGEPAPPPTKSPSEFERVARTLGLSEVSYSESRELRQWCEENRNRFYIPEWLLKRWGMKVAEHDL